MTTLTVPLDKEDLVNLVCGLNADVAYSIGAHHLHRHPHSGNCVWLRHQLYDLSDVQLYKLCSSLKPAIYQAMCQTPNYY